MSSASEDTVKSNTPASAQIRTTQDHSHTVEESSGDSGDGGSNTAGSVPKAAIKRKRDPLEDAREDATIPVQDEGRAEHETFESSRVNGATDSPALSEGEAPPLPDEAPPPLVPEQDDGWEPIWEETAGAFYFYNRFTGAAQWTNPRVPEASQIPTVTPGVSIPVVATSEDKASAPRPAGGYDPSIHGDYDPNAWYAQQADTPNADSSDPGAAYIATGAFNRFTGRWQSADLTPENFNDENKSRRQMNAFFDVDAAANSHDGRSLKAERSGKRLSKSELKQFKEKRKAKKEEKRRAWLRD